MSSKKKDFSYSEKVSTSITKEIASPDNPFVSVKQLIHGYDLTSLVQERSFLDTVFLLITGHLATTEQEKLLNALAVALCNLGPRAYPCRAAMVAGVSKSNAGNLLPIGLSIASGADGGSKEVEESHHFIATHINDDPSALANELTSHLEKESDEFVVTAGFSSQFKHPHELYISLANTLLEQHQCHTLEWALLFSQAISHTGASINPCGLAAAVLFDLGIPARESGVLYQFLIAPGILAHGLEQTHKPITSIPFLSDDKYEFN